MIWAVLDTNVLVSGFGWPGGPPGRILDHALAGRFLIVTSTPLLDELGRVLQYPKLASVFSDPMPYVLLVETMAIRVEPTTEVSIAARSI